MENYSNSMGSLTNSVNKSQSMEIRSIYWKTSNISNFLEDTSRKDELAGLNFKYFIEIKLH